MIAAAVLPGSRNARYPRTMFTVVTVCRNSEHVIRKTIESVLMQTYPNIEYIIVDGKSSDSTVDAAKSYQDSFGKKGCRYKIVSEPDQGIYDAMNKGIQLASGQVVGFINAGDWYEKNAVSIAAEEYENTFYDYFFGNIHLVRADGRVITKYAKADLFPSSRHWNHPSSFVKKSVYDELGGFRCQGIHDDFEFYLRVRRAKKKIVTVNKVLANFSAGGISNQKNLRMCRQRVMDRFRSYRVNGYSPLSLFECIGMEAAKYMLG